MRRVATRRLERIDILYRAIKNLIFDSRLFLYF
jgi:hypothetical protein